MLQEFNQRLSHKILQKFSLRNSQEVATSSYSEMFTRIPKKSHLQKFIQKLFSAFLSTDFDEYFFKILFPEFFPSTFLKNPEDLFFIKILLKNFQRVPQILFREVLLKLSTEYLQKFTRKLFHKSINRFFRSVFLRFLLKFQKLPKGLPK